MKWITRKRLETEFGLPWAVAEAILARECNARRYGKGCRRDRWLVSAIWLGALVWLLGGATRTFPSMHHASLALVELPGLALVFVALFVLPRLFAHDAILAAAQQARADRSTGPASADAGTASHTACRE